MNRIMHRHALLIALLCCIAPTSVALEAGRGGIDDGSRGDGRSVPSPNAVVRLALPPSGGMAVRDVVRSEPPKDRTPGVSLTLSAVDDGEAEPNDGTEMENSRDPMILAMIDGKPITDDDVMRELWARRGKETLDWLIGRAVLDKELFRLGLKISDSEVEDRLRIHLENLRRAFPGVSRPSDLTRAASGMSLEEYRDRAVWVELALRKIMRAVHRPKDEDLRKYYARRRDEFVQPERVLLSQIFIAPVPNPESDDVPGPAEWALAEKQILRAYNELRTGKEFSEVASAYGTGSQASRWIERGELLRELEDAAFSISPGSISAPLRTSMGYHILEIEDRRDRTLPRFEDVRSDLLAEYEEEAFVALAGDFMAKLKQKAIAAGDLVVAEAPELFADTK